MSSITESLKKALFNKPKKEELSSEPDVDKVEIHVEDNIPTGFFDSYDTTYYGNMSKDTYIQEQTRLIKTYRKLSNQPEVANAVSIIVDEAIFSPGSDEIIELDFKGDTSDSLKKKLIQELKNINNQINLDKNIYALFNRFYIDGQLILHTPFVDKDLKKGVKDIKVLSPLNFGFNRDKDVWEYVETVNIGGYTNTTSTKGGDISFDRDEIIRVDSGIYSDNLILGNLNESILPSNILKSLEDALVPMRFTRSVSRRLFNVNVGRLNGNKAQEAMNKIKESFKYKKFYNLETGTISNQQHISSLVEDYWMPNQGGERGLQVDTIDETGNLGELGDILHIKRKLYTSLKVPTNRINDEGSNSEFDFTGSSIDREELKFFNFISRLRNQFLELFYELLKRNSVAKGICTQKEWEDTIVKDTKIKFVSENKFFERMEREKLQESLNLFRDIEDMAGKYFSYEYIFKDVLGMSDDGIEKLQEQIKKEKEDDFYKQFYSSSEDGDEWK